MRFTKRISDECIEVLLADGKKKMYWDRVNRLIFPAVQKLAEYEDLSEIKADDMPKEAGRMTV